MDSIDTVFDEFDINGFDNIDLDLDFDMSDFAMIDDHTETRYITPKMGKDTVCGAVKYKYAMDLANDVDLSRRTFAVISGSFIFGDFLEALVSLKKIDPKRIYISTLSMSMDNIDSFKNILLMCTNLEEFNIIVSGYFYSHEKRDLIPYMYQELDIDERFQFAVCGSHCKIVLIETHDGKYYVMHGSANMRSSRNLEQFEIEESKELFDFNVEYMDAILKTYGTIKKDIRSNELWQAVAEGTQKLKENNLPGQEN